MGRLIEYQPAAGPALVLAMNVGDVITASAFGARARAGVELMEIVGPLTPAVVGDNREILSPMGAPNTVLIVARKAGHATVELKIGDPWNAPKDAILELEIQP